MIVQPSDTFRGRFTLPGDKSLSHRLAILGALAEGETRIFNFSAAADCESTLGCLSALGVDVRREDGAVLVLGAGPEGLRPAPGPLDAGNSGTTLRLLAGVLAGRPFRSLLTGDASLCQRPVERVARPLRAMGAQAASTDGRPPLEIVGGSLRGISWELDVPSAQVKSAILLAGLQARGATTVREPLPSRDHTERLLPAFGVPLEVAGGAVGVHGQGALRPVTMTVPGDVSSAAFLVVAALIRPLGHVRLERVLLNPRRTAFLDVLRSMGARIDTGLEATTPEPWGWVEAHASRLRNVVIPPLLVPDLIDEIPALCAAAVHADGTFAVSGAAELRVKESDRIAALTEVLSRLGAAVTERSDGLAIEGGHRLRGAVVNARGDHRIAMAAAVAALGAASPTEIEDGACASVSFPDFFPLLQRAAADHRPARVVLVGMMGSGKTTVAALLARRLGWDCVDMDAELERRAGLSIREMFTRIGEEGFRQREHALALDLRARDRVVIAAGGGAFARRETREALRRNAFSVWLRCDVETVLARVPRDGSRPLAASRETILRLFAEREPSYRLADWSVDASPAPELVARRIEEAVLSGGLPTPLSPS